MTILKFVGQGNCREAAAGDVLRQSQSHLRVVACDGLATLDLRAAGRPMKRQRLVPFLRECYSLLVKRSASWARDTLSVCTDPNLVAVSFSYLPMAFS
jgi:hypothetical protein